MVNKYGVKPHIHKPLNDSIYKLKIKQSYVEEQPSIKEIEFNRVRGGYRDLKHFDLRRNC